MKQFYLKNIVFLILFSIFMANTLLYYAWLEADIEFIELCDSEEKENKTEEEKQERDDKIPTNILEADYLASYIQMKQFLSSCFFDSHYVEIQTPPPEVYS